MLSRLLAPTAREFALATVFSTVVAAVVGGVSLALWAADISLVQTGIEGELGPVALAATLPAFFAGQVFFLLRRVAVSGPAEAFAVGGAIAGGAVLAHHNVLNSRFFDLGHGGDGVTGSDWLAAAFDLMPREGPLMVSGQVMTAEVAVVVGVAVATLLLQRAWVGVQGRR